MKKDIHMFVVLSLSFNLLISCSSSPKEKVSQKTDIVVKDVIPKLYSVPVDTPDYVLSIEKYRDSLDKNLTTLKVKKIDVFGSSAEGGEIDIYTKRADTLKLRAVYYGETGKREYQIYLLSQAPVYLREKLSSYKSPIGKTPVKIESIIIKDFVLKDGMVLFGKKGKEVISTEAYRQKSIDISNLYKEVILAEKNL